MSLFQELKRRNVFKVGIVYLVASWLLLQVTDILVPILGLPETAAKFVFLLLVIGFIPALIVAWAFELTPEGIKREKDVDRSQSITSQTGRKLDFVIIGILIVAVTVLLIERFTSSPVIPSNNTTVIPADAGIQTASSEPTSTNAPDEAVQAAQPHEKSIAVLPFANMSSDPEQEYFSDGLAEELLNRLAQTGKLRVAARTSAFQFKGQNLDVAEIGRQLKVDNVLEGSVRKSGNRLRITAQLINVADGFHIWSETYEREMDDIFAIQDDISGAISRALELELGMSAPAPEVRPTQSLEAYNLYLRGRFLLAARGGDNLLQANELFERAVALDPDFASAWSAMAFNAAVMFGYTYERPLDDVYALAVRAANRAIELDPDNAEAWTALGRAEAIYMTNWQAGLAASSRAYELAPDNAEVANLYGDVLIMLGDFEAAERIETKATILDPLSATNATDLAFLLLLLNRPQEALQPARNAVELAPDSYYRIDPLIQCLLRLGRFEEGKALIEETIERLNVDELDPLTVTNWWAWYFYQKNDVPALRAWLDERLATVHSEAAVRAKETNRPEASTYAFYLLWTDGATAAIPWLEQARANGEWRLAWPELVYLPERMSTDPAWLEFWNEPDYQELFDIRRAHPYEHVGWWKERPEQ